MLQLENVVEIMMEVKNSIFYQINIRFEVSNIKLSLNLLELVIFKLKA